MADQRKRGGSDGENPKGSGEQWDAFFRKTGFDPAQVPEGITCLSGILGKSSKAGYSVLYLGLDMTERAEIRDEDILFSEPLPPERSPFGTLGGTVVCVKKGANVVYSHTTSRQVPAESLQTDEFDLDIRLGGSGARRMQSGRANLQPISNWNTQCAPECGGGGTGDQQTCLTCVSCGDTCFRTCRDTCRTMCDTCPGDTCRTCETCRTNCGTCRTCHTCQTRCGTCQTCQTCATQCATCTPTQCDTCVTCDTCDTCRRTQCETCVACTHVTCFRTCDIC
jgi:hypothetical protein